MTRPRNISISVHLFWIVIGYVYNIRHVRYVTGVGTTHETGFDAALAAALDIGLDTVPQTLLETRFATALDIKQCAAPDTALRTARDSIGKASFLILIGN